MLAPMLGSMGPGDKVTLHKNPKPSWLESMGQGAGAGQAQPQAPAQPRPMLQSPMPPPQVPPPPMSMMGMGPASPLPSRYAKFANNPLSQQLAQQLLLRSGR